MAAQRKRRGRKAALSGKAYVDGELYRPSLDEVRKAAVKAMVGIDGPRLTAIQ